MRRRLILVALVLAACAAALPASAEFYRETWRTPFGVPRGVSASLPDGSSWVATGGSVLHLSAAGAVLSQTDGFWSPWSVSADPTDGSCWVADSANNQVVHLSSAGVEQWRGSGFSYPYSVSANPADGSCWVADYGNNQVVHLRADGFELWRGGSFSGPLAVSAVPSSGSCWVADAGNNQVVLLTSEGVESKRVSGFNSPWSVSANSTDGSCWVADTYNNQVVHLRADGYQLSRGGGFSWPMSVSVNPANGSCWVADYVHHQIVHLSSTGSQLYRTPDSTSFSYPTSVAVDSGDGSCWVGDYGNGQVAHLSSAGVETWRDDGLAGPSSVSFDPADNSCWVADTYGDAVVHLSDDGDRLWRGDTFSYPRSVAVDPSNGSCWVADTYDNEIAHLSSAGAESWRGGGFTYPGAVAVDPGDNSCWVADSTANEVAHLSAEGVEQSRTGGYLFPSSVSVDPVDGSCWVAVLDTNEVARLDSKGVGMWRVSGFSSPTSVSVDPVDESCWVADRDNNRVVHLRADGYDLWHGGTFDKPQGVFADPRDGSCWVTDSGAGQVVHLAANGTELWRGGRFTDPRAVSINTADGSCWVADFGDGQVVRLMPVIVLVEAGPNKTIAAGGSATLEGSASNGAPPYTYSWSPTTGLDDATAAHPTASPATTTTYTLTVTDSLAQTGSDTVTVTVASAVVAEAGANKTIAAGGGTTLEGTASGGLAPYTYSWSPTTGLSSPTAAQPTASPSSTTTYTLTVTDDLGQTDTDTVTVTVAPPVVAEAGPNATIAAGGHATLVGSASGGASPYSYAWSPATGLSSATVAQPIASPTSTTTYTLTVTDHIGQTDTDTVTVTVASAVVAEAGPSKAILPGGSATLQGSASGGISPYAYSWSPATGLSSATVAQPTASPSSTTTYTLTVTDNLGQIDTDTVVVTVATPVVAEAGTDRTIASGGSATLLGAASGGIAPYTYSWSPATGLSNATVAQPVASPSSTTTYTLTVTDGLAQTDTDTVTVAVAPPVIAEAGPGATLPAGGHTTLLGSASGGVPPYSYSWSPATGLSSATVAEPTASPTSTTTYTLTVTDHIGQTDTDTVTVTIASAVVAEAGPNKAIMGGGSATLEGSASGGVPPYTYAWSPTAGLNDAALAQPIASPGTTTTYTLTVTDDLGQTDTDTVTVTVASAVVAEAGPDRTIASGGSATLLGAASGGIAPYTYSWSPTAGLSSAAVAQPTASPSSTTTYTLTVTDDLGQTDTDTVTVTIAPAVVAEAGPDKTIAGGGSATLEGSASGGVPPFTYAWSPTTWLNDPAAAQPTASPLGTTTYTLTVTDSLTQTSTDTVTVVVTAPPIAAFSATPLAGVAPLTVTFADESIGTIGTWSWDFGDSGTATTQHPTHQYAAPGSYAVSLTVSGTYGSDTETKAAYITVTSAIAAAFSASGAAGTVPLTVTFDDLSTGGATTWAWDFGDGSTSTEKDPSHTYETPGYYTVTLTATAGVAADTETKPGCVAAGFTDTPADHWAFHNILACATAGVVQGYWDNSYKPDNVVTRDQMAVYIARAMAGGDENVPDPSVSTPTFPDVDGEHWAYRHIEYCSATGIVQGYPNGDYRPDQSVNRGQMAVYIARSVATPTGDTGVPEGPANATFSDVTSTSADWAWCYKYVEYCAGLDIVQGYWDGTYHPERDVTRDQMAVYVQRAFELPMYKP